MANVRYEQVANVRCEQVTDMRCEQVANEQVADEQMKLTLGWCFEAISKRVKGPRCNEPFIGGAYGVQ